MERYPLDSKNRHQIMQSHIQDTMERYSPDTKNRHQPMQSHAKQYKGKVFPRFSKQTSDNVESYAMESYSLDSKKKDIRQCRVRYQTVQWKGISQILLKTSVDHELLGNYKVLSQIKIVFVASRINRRSCRDHMLVGFTTTYAICAYLH